MQGSQPRSASPSAARAGASVGLEEALHPDQLVEVQRLVEEYARSLDISPCFQDLHAELAGLPGDYAPPRGLLLLGRLDGRPAGCVALRPLDAGVCEMKRLYVRPEARGTGLGGQLVRRAIAQAAALGYARMRLHTLPRMGVAVAMYRRLGFRPIAGYEDHPLPDSLYFELDLRADAPVA